MQAPSGPAAEIEGRTPPPIGRLRRYIVLVLALELFVLLTIETLFIYSNLKTAGGDLLNPAIEAAEFTAQFAINLLNQPLALQVGDGLIATGYFSEVTIMDDFGNTLAHLNTPKPPAEMTVSFARMIGLDLVYDVVTEIASRSGRDGSISVQVYLVDYFWDQIQRAGLRTFTLLSITFLLTYLFSKVLVDLIEGSVRELMNWTAQVARNSDSRIPASSVFKFAEMSALAKTTDKVFKSQQKTLGEVATAHKQRADLLSAVAEAFQNVDVYSSLMGPENEVLLSNFDMLQSEKLRKVFALEPFTRTALKDAATQNDMLMINLDSGENERPADTLFRVQLSTATESWIVQANVIRDNFTFLSASEVTDVRENERRSMHRDKLESLGRIVGGVTHEFNNVLAIITASIDESIATYEEKNIPILESLRMSQIACDRAKSTTGQLGQISSGYIDRNSVVDLDIWSLSANAFFGAITGPAVKLTIDVEPDLQVSTDPSLFDAAVLNLCKNASDAMGRVGEIGIQIRRANQSDILHFPDLDPKARYVSFKISDTGPGVSAEHAEKLFDPFFTTKEVGEGTGIGLSTVYGFAKNSGGGIRLDRGCSNGACFHFVLPELARDAALHNGNRSAPKVEKLLDGVSVLIVDDEVVLNSLYQRGLAKAGAKVFFAHSLREAREVISTASRLDVAILDNSLGDGIGSSLTSEIHAKFPEIPCISLSGEMDLPWNTYSAICRRLSKPIALSELVLAVHQELGVACSSGIATLAP